MSKVGKIIISALMISMPALHTAPTKKSHSSRWKTACIASSLGVVVGVGAYIAYRAAHNETTVQLPVEGMSVGEQVTTPSSGWKEIAQNVIQSGKSWWSSCYAWLQQKAVEMNEQKKKMKFSVNMPPEFIEQAREVYSQGTSNK